jgi:ABC-type lipoprotein release transport system permease subunit
MAVLAPIRSRRRSRLWYRTTLFIGVVRVLGSRIPGVRPEWGVGLGIGAIGFAALIVLATLLPTRRAAAVEPSIALASE